MQEDHQGISDRSSPRQALILGLIGSSIYLILAFIFRRHALDDAFITFRFSQHLAQGLGFCWNRSGPPVEGFTSLLWVVVTAGGLKLGASALGTAQALSLLGGLILIWSGAWSSRRLAWPVSLVLVMALGANPCLALLSMQGMETVAAGLLLLAFTWSAMRFLAERRTGWAAGSGALLLLSYFCRPESIIFCGLVMAGLWLQLLAERDRRSLLVLSLTGLALAGALAVYTGWRVSYFGHWFPTSYYLKVKAFSGTVNFQALINAIGFSIFFLVPPVGFCLAAARLSPAGLRRRALIIISGAFLVHLIGTLRVIPIQGYGFRFIFPAYPSLLLALSWSLVQREGSGTAARYGRIVAGFLVTGWFLVLLPQTLTWADVTDPRDRILMGRALKGIPGVMFTSESGALPYLSEWESYDLVGLTDWETAIDGISTGRLETINPDLIMLHEPSGHYSPHLPRKIIVHEYMVTHGYVAVAATRKREVEYHFYFIRRDSPLARQILDRVLNVQGIEYGDLSKLVGDPNMPILSPGEANHHGR